MQLLSSTQVMKEFSEVTQPGANLVDLLPVLKYFPDWVPGTGFKRSRTARAYRKTLDVLGERPVAHVKEDMANGITNTSFVGTLMREEPDLMPERLFDITWAAGRLRQAVLTCFPHCTTADDVYDGYLIPKGSMVFPNVWKFLHGLYDEPSAFKPERFLGPDSAPDPRDMGFFGYGGRQQPPSRASVWMHVAYAVAALHISKPVDTMGNLIVPPGDTDTGLILRPLPFVCKIRPRSSDALRLIKERIDQRSD
ncbi:cytochrome P450 [Schizophyllum fasciatum]